MPKAVKHISAIILQTLDQFSIVQQVMIQNLCVDTSMKYYARILFDTMNFSAVSEN